MIQLMWRLILNLRYFPFQHCYPLFPSLTSNYANKVIFMHKAHSSFKITPLSHTITRPRLLRNLFTLTKIVFGWGREIGGKEMKKKKKKNEVK